MGLTKGMTTIVLAAAMLAACGGAATTAPDAASGGEPAGQYSSTNFDTSYSDALAAQNQLILGTLKLDETDAPIDAAQAATLLPLWQGVRSLLNSSTAAQAEIDALLKQIEKSMKPEQLAAIRDMRLTQADLVEYARSNNLVLGGGQLAPGGGAGPAGGLISPELRATLQAGGELPPELQATLEARQAQGGFGPGGAFARELFATIQAGGEIPPELQATLEARQAQGGFGPGGAFAPGVRATFQAGGDIPPEIRATIEARGGPAGFVVNRGGAGLVLIDRIVALLEARANP